MKNSVQIKSYLICLERDLYGFDGCGLLLVVRRLLIGGNGFVHRLPDTFPVSLIPFVGIMIYQHRLAGRNRGKHITGFLGKGAAFGSGLFGLIKITVNSSLLLAFIFVYGVHLLTDW